jgi:hypothetical protein
MKTPKKTTLLKKMINTNNNSLNSKSNNKCNQTTPTNFTESPMKKKNSENVNIYLVSPYLIATPGCWQ